ncbi:hypothetical protein [Myroides sp. N17-2]|uniref:hypothetical protein n=1 Tax=Myroides sp. N17-2 TaxID=2030799 RepID=UPI000EFB6F50|nr:hypothetical protein [Myroides sp. N17-2]
MKNKNLYTNYLKVDYRANGLNQIIQGLDNAIKSLEYRVNEQDWYDGIWFREDSEPIYGLAFIAFQNYINGSIKDLVNSTSEKVKYYRLEPNFDIYEKSHIELIIGLANYIKHKDDDGELRKGTSDILRSFNLDVSKNPDIVESSPIFIGLTILSETWNLFEIELNVTNWRANLFKTINQ